MTYLAEWIQTRTVDTTPERDQYFRQQLEFVQGRVVTVLAPNRNNIAQILNGIRVVGEHTSAFVVLPVYSIELPNGVKLTMRGNHFNWIISVNSPQDATANYAGLFEEDKEISPAFCNGFPRYLVYGSYRRNKLRFTIRLQDDYDLYAFLRIFTNVAMGYRG